MTEPAERVLDDARTLSEAVFRALGAASTAWENPGGAGVFDSTRAKQIGDELLAGIREGRWPDEKTGAVGAVGSAEPTDDLRRVLEWCTQQPSTSVGVAGRDVAVAMPIEVINAAARALARVAGVEQNGATL